MTIKIKLTPPSKDAPGYLRRLDKTLSFQAAMKQAAATKEYPADLIKGIVEFLADYVTEPADRSAAIEALWECTENQFTGMIDAITGVGNEIPFQETNSQN